jgi:hypothetical protein
VGAAYGYGPAQVCRQALRTVAGERAAATLTLEDIDRPLPAAVVTALAAVTGQSEPAIVALDLGPLTWPLVPARVQWCPPCLAGDAVPYLRRAWRDALTVVCPLHRRVLVEQCDGCGAPLSMQYAQTRAAAAAAAAGQAWLTVCPRCAADRRRAAAHPTPPELTRPPEREWAQLVTFEAIRTRGYLDLARPPGMPRVLSAQRYLDGIWALARYMSVSVHAGGLRPWVSAALGLLDFAVPPARDFVARGVWVRRRLVRLVLAMLEDWPGRFAALCEGPLRCRDSPFGGPPGHGPPQWLNEVAERHTALGRRRRQEEWYCLWRSGLRRRWPGPWNHPPRYHAAAADARSWAAHLLTPEEDDEEAGS